jgi:hypothetical protein
VKPKRSIHRNDRLVLESLKSQLLKHRDVIGVTTGHRVRKGQELPEECITVFVTKKHPPSRLRAGRRLPSYFLARHKDGSVNRKRRIYTDIVQIQRVKPLTAGGFGLNVLGDDGTMTMAFRRNGLQSGEYLLSNRHVLVPRVNQSANAVDMRIQGQLVAIASVDSYFQVPAEGGNTFLDAGLALLNNSAQGVVQVLKILEGVTSINIIGTRQLGDRENGTFWISGSRSLVRSGSLWDRVQGGGAWIVDYRHLGTLSLQRLYALKVATIHGDSGAPIYEKDATGNAILVGIAVAIATDPSTGRKLTLFHSITDIESGFRSLLNDPQFVFV